MTATIRHRAYLPFLDAIKPLVRKCTGLYVWSNNGRDFLRFDALTEDEADTIRLAARRFNVDFQVGLSADNAEIVRVWF